MKRSKYFYQKIISAWRSDVLWEKTIRFIYSALRNTFIIPILYLSLPKSDRTLNIKDGFKDHRNNKVHASPRVEHINRIISSYNYAINEQNNIPEVFHIRGLWEEWISINYSKLVNALKSKDIPQISSIYKNLFREQCTTGTGGYDDYIRYHSLLGKTQLKYTWAKYRDILLENDYNLESLDFPFLGNPCGISYNGGIIPIETLRHAYRANEITNCLRNIPQNTIVEIGGGLGGLAYHTIKQQANNNAKFLIFDIPEVLPLSAYFLMSSFPNKTIRLFGEDTISADPSEKYDIGLFPHFTISKLSDSSIDLFYNSCSFSEMDEKCSAEYLTIIERTCRKYLIHDNHDTDHVFTYSDGSTSKNIRGSKFVPNTEIFKRIYKKPRVHSRPEDKSFTHYEYLYERM